MGRIIRAQKKGKQNSIFGNRYKKLTKIPLYSSIQPGLFELKTIVNYRGKIIGLIQNSDLSFYLQLPSKAYTGQSINFRGSQIEENSVNIVPLGLAPVKTPVFNVQPLGKKGKLATSPGSFYEIIKHQKDYTLVKAPSKQKLKLSKETLVTLGKSANSGLVTRPFFTAGNRFHHMRSIGKKYPLVSPNKMNVVDHKLGGTLRKRRGFSLCVNRDRPPGAKIGNLAPRRTGRKR